MNKTFFPQDPEIANYVDQLLKPEDAILREIRLRSVENGLPPIQVGSLDALHLELIARALGASRIVEIGTLGGYSGVALARGLTQLGTLYTFELEKRNFEVAKESFNKAGVAGKVKMFLGPALENLKQIEAEAPFDLVFIDADKSNYINYFNWAAKHLRVGGAVLADNTFGFGLIHKDLQDNDPDFKSVQHLRKFNQYVSKDHRFRTTMIPTGEGLTFSLKVLP